MENTTKMEQWEKTIKKIYIAFKEKLTTIGIPITMTNQ